MSNIGLKGGERKTQADKEAIIRRSIKKKRENVGNANDRKIGIKRVSRRIKKEEWVRVEKNVFIEKTTGTKNNKE